MLVESTGEHTSWTVAPKMRDQERARNVTTSTSRYAELMHLEVPANVMRREVAEESPAELENRRHRLARGNPGANRLEPANDPPVDRVVLEALKMRRMRPTDDRAGVGGEIRMSPPA